ncbi:Hypothetical_protein [Hexamita inflata]|uniref:Hypothetical_protein n=1 Tax=Hexamita inflata TaxID=28002 RepID=A0AA86UNV3_9EUKA|nr:Hypothetical protein HINF_LOCUS33648 [Hexamita inflata]
MLASFRQFYLIDYLIREDASFAFHSKLQLTQLVVSEVYKQMCEQQVKLNQGRYTQRMQQVRRWTNWKMRLLSEVMQLYTANYFNTISQFYELYANTNMCMFLIIVFYKLNLQKQSTFKIYVKNAYLNNQVKKNEYFFRLQCYTVKSRQKTLGYTRVYTLEK